MKGNGITRISAISVHNGYLSFQCTSKLYKVTDAGGKAETALKNGFVSLGDGCDYILNENDKKQIKRLLSK